MILLNAGPEVFLAHLIDEGPVSSLVQTLVSSLGARGVSVLRGEQVTPLGEDIRKSVLPAMLRADGVVVLWSTQTGSHSWVVEELEFALSSGRPTCLVLLLDAAPPSQWPQERRHVRLRGVAPFGFEGLAPFSKHPSWRFDPPAFDHSVQEIANFAEWAKHRSRGTPLPPHVLWA